MAINNSPLSIGEFLYDPITSWQKFFNPHITLNYKPTTNEIEGHVLERAGSYGKQLGIIIDMLAVLKSQIIESDNHLSDEQKTAINAFNVLASNVKSAIRDYKGDVVKQDVDQLMSRLEKVKEQSPGVYQECIDKLEQSIAE